MAFVVEDGTGLANSNALADVAFVDAYHADRGVAAWAALTTPAKQAAIVAATDYIHARWAERLRGEQSRVGIQALDFPRVDIGYDGVYDDSVPYPVQQAVALYALRASSGPLAPDPVVDASGRTTASTRRKVGPIETETTFADSGPGSRVQRFRDYPAADALMRRFLVAASAGVVR